MAGEPPEGYAGPSRRVFCDASTPFSFFLRRVVYLRGHFIQDRELVVATLLWSRERHVDSF
jgi:hypothetical protein